MDWIFTEALNSLCGINAPTHHRFRVVRPGVALSVGIPGEDYSKGKEFTNDIIYIELLTDRGIRRGITMGMTSALLARAVIDQAINDSGI
jgi:hypothetical protein